MRGKEMIDKNILMANEAILRATHSSANNKTMRLTLAITVYNRYDLLLESFSQVLDDDRIDEILIMDDCSDPKYWGKIKELPSLSPKIKVVRQLENRGMSYNKMSAVANSKNSWVILFDSDNVIGKDYLDALYSLERLQKRFIFCPSFAKPNFDYRKFEGIRYSPNNRPDLSDSMMNCLFNTCNYVVERKPYLNVWEENKDIGCADTIWFNYLWLKAGGYFIVVPGMEYQHRVHKDSGFMKDLDYNMAKAEEIKKMIMSL